MIHASTIDKGKMYARMSLYIYLMIHWTTVGADPLESNSWIRNDPGVAVSGSAPLAANQLSTSNSSLTGTPNLASLQPQILPSSPLSQRLGSQRQLQAVTTTLAGSTQPQPVFIIQNGQLVQLFQAQPVPAQPVAANSAPPQMSQVPNDPSPAGQIAQLTKPEPSEQAGAQGSPTQIQMDPLTTMQLNPLGNIPGIEIVPWPSMSSSVLPTGSVRLPKDYMGVLRVIRDGEFARIVAIPPMTRSQQATFSSINQAPHNESSTVKPLVPQTGPIISPGEVDDPSLIIPKTSPLLTIPKLDPSLSGTLNHTGTGPGLAPPPLSPVPGYQTNLNDQPSKQPALPNNSTTQNVATPKSTSGTGGQLPTSPKETQVNGTTKTELNQATVLPTSNPAGYASGQGNTTYTNSAATSSNSNLESAPRGSTIQSGSAMYADSTGVSTFAMTESLATKSIGYSIFSFILLIVLV